MEIKQSKNKLLIPALVGGVVLIAVVLLVVLLAGSGSKKVVKNFGKALEKEKPKLICKSYNKEIIEGKEWDDCEDDVENYFDSHDFKNFTIKSSKEVSKDDLEEISEDFEDDYDVDAKKVKKVVRYKIEYKTRLEDDDKEWEKVTRYFWVAKVNGKWGIIGITRDKEYSFDIDDI